MKEVVIRFLQKLLGYQRYLWIFTQFKLSTLRSSADEKSFFHFVSLLESEHKVLDIGANLGLMSYFLSIQCDTVHAFVPMPNNLANLTKLKAEKDLYNLTILPYALSNEGGVLTMVLPEIKGAKKQGLSHVLTDKIQDFNDGDTVEVDCYRLDDVTELQGERVDAIKIDVENFEYEVFLGAQKLIQEHQPLIYCELWDNQNRKDCFTLMGELDYSVKHLVNNTLEIFDGENSDTLNFFFVPNNRKFDKVN